MSCKCFGASAILWKNSNKQARKSKQEQEAVIVTRTRIFSFDELRAATNNFNLGNKIGRGGFGVVYKGILKNGMKVAVKMLSAESKQGEREFLTEIETISDVKHPNLVQLLGCCVHGRDQILVYEYLENNSIDRALLGICTFVYMKWSDQKLLAEWAWELYQEGKLLDLVDPELEEFPKDEVLRYMKVALFCTQAAASRRPLMSQVIEMLSRNVRLNENELTPPGFFDDSASLSGRSSKDNKDKIYGTTASYQISSFPSTITQVTPR